MAIYIITYLLSWFFLYIYSHIKNKAVKRLWMRILWRRWESKRKKSQADECISAVIPIYKESNDCLCFETPKKNKLGEVKE